MVKSGRLPDRANNSNSAQPVRTCVGCRKRDDKTALVRVVVYRGEFFPDLRARMLGRGAYLHARAECVEFALRRRALQRSLRAPGGIRDAPLREISDTWK